MQNVQNDFKFLHHNIDKICKLEKMGVDKLNEKLEKVKKKILNCNQNKTNIKLNIDLKLINEAIFRLKIK